MMKTWFRLLCSQLFLVGIILNLVGAIRHDDFSVRTVSAIIGPAFWYAGLLLPFSGSARADKIAPWFVLLGAWLLMSAALCRGFDIASMSVVVPIFLSGPALTLLLIGAGYGLARIRR